MLGRLRTASDSLGSVSSALGGKNRARADGGRTDAGGERRRDGLPQLPPPSYCWSAAYNDTAGIFNSAAKCIEDKGGIQTADLPEYFTARCIHREEILNEFNLAANALALASHKEETVAENRRIMAAQYEAFGSYVTGICDEITKLSRFDENLGRRVRQFFLNLGASSCEAMAYYDRYDALYLEADAVLPQSVSDKKCWRGSASCAVMSWPANRANTATASTPTASASVKPRAAGDGGAAEQERRECLRRQLLRIQVRPLPKRCSPFPTAWAAARRPGA